LSIDVYKEWLGIPDGPRPPDHYQLLRLVDFEDSPEKIRANYKKLNTHVRKYATGQYSVESQGLLNELARAMLCLTDVERKQDYDRSLGREFEDEKTAAGRKLMETLLIERQHISQSQLKEAKQHAERSGLDLRDSLVQLKLVDQDVAAQALAEEIGLPYLDLSDVTPEDAALDKVPRSMVKQHSILPLFIDDDTVLISCVNQLDHDVEDELRLRFELPIRCVLATPSAINQGIARFYAPGMRTESAADMKTTKGKSTAGSPKKSSGETRTVRERKVLTPEELKQRRQLGIVIVNFSFLAAYIVDWYIFNPGIADIWMYFVIPGIAAATAYFTCWSKK